MTSILDKHPAPWRGWDDKHDFTIVDSTGVEVFPLQLIISREAPDELKRLILAAPELLMALKACVRFVPNTGGPGPFGEARKTYEAAKALIARIEGGK